MSENKKFLWITSKKIYEAHIVKQYLPETISFEQKNSYGLHSKKFHTKGPDPNLCLQIMVYFCKFEK